MCLNRLSILCLIVLWLTRPILIYILWIIDKTTIWLTLVCWTTPIIPILLTIRTPVYNRASLINKLFDSLIKQKNKNFIWMVIDDGSSYKWGKKRNLLYDNKWKLLFQRSPKKIWNKKNQRKCKMNCVKAVR